MYFYLSTDMHRHIQMLPNIKEIATLKKYTLESKTAQSIQPNQLSNSIKFLRYLKLKKIYRLIEESRPRPHMQKFCLAASLL